MRFSPDFAGNFANFCGVRRLTRCYVLRACFLDKNFSSAHADWQF
jgi:hypothetical protein